MLRFGAFWLLLAGHATATCGPPPIALPITDVLLSNGHTRRGVQTAVGTPARNISFMINGFLNDTWIYNATDSFCSTNDTAAKCITTRGGLYDPGQSSTYDQKADARLAGSDGSDTEKIVWSSAWATDEFQLANISLSDYPIGMPGFDVSGPFDTQAFMGLGQNSTLLQKLKDAGLIASRSYSYWWGIDNSESRSVMDGQLVLGGYDAAKVSGAPLTQPLLQPTSACPSGMTLSFTDLTLNFPNGTSTDSLNPRQILTACVQPDFPAVMTIRADPYFWRFQDITRTSFTNRTLGTYWYTPTYPSDNVYLGALEIGVRGGQPITISNDILVVPDEWTGQSGVTQYNTSTAVLLFSPLDGPNINDPMILGMAFFSAAYITVNLDNGTWSLWPATATQDLRLVGIGADGCEDVGNVVKGNVTDPSPAVEPEEENADGLSIAAKAGIGAGSGALLLAVVSLAVCCALRRRKNSRRRDAAVSGIDSPHCTAGGAQELESTMFGHGYPYEMKGSQTVPYELRALEKPGEMLAPETKQARVYYSPVELPSHRW